MIKAVASNLKYNFKIIILIEDSFKDLFFLFPYFGISPDIFMVNGDIELHFQMCPVDGADVPIIENSHSAPSDSL